MILESIMGEYPHVKTECDFLLAEIKNQANTAHETTKSSNNVNPILQFLRNKGLTAVQLHLHVAEGLIKKSLRECKNNDELKALLDIPEVQTAINTLEKNPENTYCIEKHLVSMFMYNQNKGSSWSNQFHIYSAIQSIPFLKPRREKIIKWITKFTKSALEREDTEYDENTHDIYAHKDPLLLKGFFTQNQEFKDIQTNLINKMSKSPNPPNIICRVKRYGIT